jgi:hypothetical protein
LRSCANRARARRHGFPGGDRAVVGLGEARPPEHGCWSGAMSELGLGCVKTRRRSIAIEELVRPRPF